MNKIIINNKNVEIETDIVYKAIELYYDGELYIENLLPSDYIVQKVNNKIGSKIKNKENKNGCK